MNRLIKKYINKNIDIKYPTDDRQIYFIKLSTHSVLFFFTRIFVIVILFNAVLYELVNVQLNEVANIQQ